MRMKNEPLIISVLLGEQSQNKNKKIILIRKQNV